MYIDEPLRKKLSIQYSVQVVWPSRFINEIIPAVSIFTWWPYRAIHLVWCLLKGQMKCEDDELSSISGVFSSITSHRLFTWSFYFLLLLSNAITYVKWDGMYWRWDVYKFNNQAANSKEIITGKRYPSLRKWSPVFSVLVQACYFHTVSLV